MANFIVGLTGGIGCGKTTIANMFTALDIDIIDADIAARQVVEPNSSALITIKNHFGDHFINADGTLNRVALRTQIFNHPEDKLWLNNLLHPLIRERMLTDIAMSNSRYCLLVAPLLLENQLDKLVDKVLVIDVSTNTQINRTILRDQSSKAVVEKIIASQIARNERVKAADDIINNESDNLSLAKLTVAMLDKIYTDLAQQKQKN
jgi:dephospho-CoA kinase